jgi:isoquinoline 1-oxidoreductase subunit beta
MSKPRDKSPQDPGRRVFLQRGALAGSGLVVALALPSNSVESASARGGGALNAWLRVGADDSITVIVDRSEMGQGVYTALPMLLAEELEIDLTAIKIVAAPVSDVYTNTLNGGQITGTSNSIAEAWDKLRKAGAQARTLLIAAAAQMWHVSPSECHAAGGLVVGPRGKSASYGQLAEVASRLPIPQEVVLKSSGQFRLIGTGLPRLDTPGKVDGSAEFGLDVRLPGMLYAVIALCPTLGGKAGAVDSAAALAMPGVRSILSTKSGVVVIAEHFWQARKARDALKISWDVGANALLDNSKIASMLETAAAGPGASALAREEVSASLKTGNAAAALKKAARTFSAVYELPLVAHATMEPMNCTADVQAERCDLYIGTQVQQIAQSAAAAAAGFKPEQVAVHTTLLGGGFGRRLEVDFVPAAVEASKAVGVPVKLVWTREDDMTHDFYRPPAREKVNAGMDASGRLTVWELHITSPSITARFDPTNQNPFDSVIEYVQNFPYAVPHFDLRYSRQEIGIDVGYLRSVSHSANCFAIESSIDELAAAASSNPLDFRLQLLAGKTRHLRVLEMVAQRSGWGHPAAPGRHQGLAFMEGYTSCIAQVAEVSVSGGVVKVHRITCVIDCGQTVNPRIVESQLESGIIYGLSAALWGGVTLQNGQVQQRNFNDYRVLRLNETPQIDIHILPSDEPPGGIGETGVPPVAPAVCNALFAATGRRVRSLPIAGQLAVAG